MKYWTKSWNVLYGCTKIRAGCTHCWALTMAARIQGNGLLEGVVDGRGEWTGRIVFKPDRMDMPRHWKEPQVVAVNWMGDTFHEKTNDIAWQSMLKVMQETPCHTYLVLTKRYEELIIRLDKHGAADNIYIGVTISNQQDAVDAITGLMSAHLDGWKTWVSFEPALEAVDWKGYGFIDGLVCGGESGKGAREMPAEAARGAQIFCMVNQIPFTFKQWGSASLLHHDPGWYEFPTSERKLRKNERLQKL